MSSLTISITEIVLRRSPQRRVRRLETDFRRARLARGEERPRVARERRELGRVVAHQILRRGAREQQRGEIVRHVAFVVAQKLSRRIDAGAGAAVFGRGTIDGDVLGHAN